jgi:Protein of unknown function (DUF3443)
MLAVVAAAGIILSGAISCGLPKTTSPATSSSATTTAKPAITESTTTAPTSAPNPPSIPLTAETTDTAPRLSVKVTIGGKTLNVLLDTGSVGLRVVASQVPPDAVRRTGSAPQFGYDDGTRLSGDLAQASVQIGDRRTAGPIPIELVTDTSCAPAVPDCPAADGKKPIMFGGRYDGVMGIGPHNVEGVVNPLWRLQDGPGHVFTIRYDPASASALVLGEPAAGYSLVHFDKGSPTNVPDAPPPWNPDVPVCFTLAALPGGKTCGKAMFDSGTPTIAIDAPGADNNGPIPAGSAITLTVGDFSHTYTTGPGTHAEILASSPSGGGSVAGLPVFAAADIRYDLAEGTIGFRAR